MSKIPLIIVSAKLGHKEVLNSLLEGHRIGFAFALSLDNELRKQDLYLVPEEYPVEGISKYRVERRI